MNKHIRALIAAGLAGTLALSTFVVPAAPARADTADELQVAAERLEALGTELTEIQAELDAYGEELESCAYDIAQKQDEIARTEAELAAAREVLASRMRTNYKAGNESFLSVLLDATSFEDLVSRIYYMDKLSGNDADCISQVQGIQYRLSDQMAALEARQHDLEATLEATQERVEEYQVKVAEAAAYYDSLDAQLQAELEAKAAAEAAERERKEAEAMARAMEAAKQESSQETESKGSSKSEAPSNVNGSSSTKDSESKDSTSTQGEASSPKSDEKKEESEQKEPEPKQEEPIQPDPEPAQPQPEPERPTVVVRDYGTYGGDGVNSAFSCIGCPYVWGAAGPNSFDCSGLVCYCYGYDRGRTTYEMTASLKASGDWKTSLSQLSYGDLVFTSSGHVGIYLGNGTFIHAPAPGRTVRVQEVFSFVGGGSYY